MLLLTSSLDALYWFDNEGSRYLQVNLIYSWFYEGSIYLGERIINFICFKYYGLAILKVR